MTTLVVCFKGKELCSKVHSAVSFLSWKHSDLVDVSDIFNIFLIRGRGRGSPRRRGGGGGSDFLLQIPGGGEGSPGGWGRGGRGAGRVFEGNLGGGSNYFLWR